ncbi:hypothetical protein GCM10027159_23680 [Lysobacter terrae]
MLPTRVLMAALGDDLLLFARSLPLLCLLSWPLLRMRNAPWRATATLLLWSLWLAMQITLEQYYLATRNPLGADLFGYSWQEIAMTIAGGTRMNAITLAGWTLPLASMVAVFAFCWRHPLQWRTHGAAVALLAGTALWLLPPVSSTLRIQGEDAHNLASNKTIAFTADIARYWLGEAPERLSSASAAVSPGGDADYPFLHPEQTPDVLGPHFANTSRRPPHLVFIVVEGLGRSFSGPDTLRGSFTPFLDELAGRSLYWSNFLAAQGRTFGVLPSVFGSLPFADKGFAALGERMPAHANLFNLLGRQGYATRFYAGTDLAFDHERTYLQKQGVQRIVDLPSFGPGYRRNPYSSWGYDDSELMARVLADGAIFDSSPVDGVTVDGAADTRPTLTVIQTISMHTSYRFAGQDAWRRRFERRLDELQIAPGDKPGYRAFADIYATILFTDDALRRYFEAAQKAPGYENTLFVITGDHRLPELPMDTKIERYHVPLIVFSPMLRQPARIRAVSSHLDLAPSMLAFLSHNYGLQRPAQVTWTGTGLDTTPEFVSRREIPLKHEKTLLDDFVAGPWFLSHDQLYVLEDGMRLALADDAAAQAQASARFDRYRQANARFARTLRLSPEGATPKLVAFDGGEGAHAPAPAATAPVPQRHTLHAHGIAAPEGTDLDHMAITAQFTNATSEPSAPFVPLLVLSDERGREVRESYAGALQLTAGASGQARFDLELKGVESGRYFLAVLPTHPDTGRRVGEGVYRIPIKVRCCAPGGGARARP